MYHLIAVADDHRKPNPVAVSAVATCTSTTRLVRCAIALFQIRDETNGREKSGLNVVAVGCHCWKSSLTNSRAVTYGRRVHKCDKAGVLRDHFLKSADKSLLIYGWMCLASQSLTTFGLAHI